MNKKEIETALSITSSIRSAATHLGTSFTNLRYWIKKHSITVEQLKRRKKIRCCSCGESDPAKFYGKQRRCKKCFNLYCTQRWIERKLRAIVYKGGKCKRCSYDRHYAAMEFHHRDPVLKDFEWPKLCRRSWHSVVIELDKCDLVCANCHREIHAELRD